ncbi:serine threonine kinase 19 [Lynx pardinus]|uniref:Serine threonine kinase 19 n=2 Tax=Felidae TaxID=9681 RepID=A0A485PN75_LYNPA|nr:serine threonine kinase 19 [Lynx pardinus]
MLQTQLRKAAWASDRGLPQSPPTWTSTSVELRRHGRCVQKSGRYARVVSALLDAIIRRQGRADPSGAGKGCALPGEADHDPAARSQPRRPRVPVPECQRRKPIRAGVRRPSSWLGRDGDPSTRPAGLQGARRHCSAPEDAVFASSSLNTDLFPGNLRPRDMSRKRHRLVPDSFGLKRRREQGQAEADPLRGESGSARAAVAELVQLFPRGLFEDALPPIALRSQVYSLVPDRTAADRQLVLKACDGRPYAGAVQKFLASVLPACGDLSFQQDQMTQTFGFRDPEITQLVNAGVLTVRDAGSWWLAVPGAGRFIKYFVKGRQAVLGMVRKAKYRELLLSELLGRRAPAAVRLGLTYHVHDLIGAQLVDCVSTTSGTLLRLPET